MEALLAVVCGLTCFVFLIEAKPTIYIQDPIRVALSGETLHLQIDVTFPGSMNGSSEIFCCPADNEARIYVSSISKTERISVEIKGLQTSHSGEYYCDWLNVRAYWAVLVREEGFRAPDSTDNGALILTVGLTMGLLLFSCIGSTALLRDYRNQTKWREERKEEGEGEGEGESDVRDAAATDSVYTDLEHGTSSIYHVIDPSALNYVRNEKLAKQQVTSETRETQDTKKEDGIFESVYENV
ncbi:hypothetical protein AAFF_G00260820 [Aldrovandia affinis]|uniref:Immunoglobulin subtype domain-containing protein n=1 Tax=Aldrovandia affinis TaxID=143900 RepID=A0AAD7RC09_9TELE|nr:hypothetical protein AAFF_G00260820 [Aldrovandia affinis]